MRNALLTLSIAAIASVGLVASAYSEPVDDQLAIDGQEMIVKAPAPEGMPFDEIYSGWLYREAETRAVEADSFENPGMIGVEQGEQIWNTVEGSAGKSCASCHGDASESMKGVAAHYPKWDEATGKPIDIELKINQERVEKMGAEPYKFDAAGQKNLTAYIKRQSLGDPVSIDLSQGDMQAWWEKGKERYYLRTGQLNLSCSNCHEDLAGKNIRADHLSQGQVNGFPTYRLKTGGLVSIMNRFRGCIRDTRAEYPAAFSDELLALEVFTTWRGTGLSVETPAVRP